MKKTSEYRAVFFRRALSVLLALALTFGDLSMGVRAAMSETEPSIPKTAEAAAQATTEAPTEAPTQATTEAPTEASTQATTETPTEAPTQATTEAPTEAPTQATTEAPTEAPTQATTEAPTEAPTQATTEAPTEAPTQATTEAPTEAPTQAPTEKPTEEPTEEPAEEATVETTEETISNEIMLFSEGSTTIPFDGYRTYPLDIYNHLHYTSANAGVTLSSGSYTISGKNVSTDTEKGQEIIIGNHPLEGNTDTDPSSEDILISLQGLTMSEGMTVKPVGSDNQYRVKLTVTEASDLGALIVEDKAQLELILEKDLEVDSITLGDKTSLTVSGSGTLTVSGAFTSQGTVALNGGIIQANEGISAKSLSLSGTKNKRKPSGRHRDGSTLHGKQYGGKCLPVWLCRGKRQKNPDPQR